MAIEGDRFKELEEKARYFSKLNYTFLLLERIQKILNIIDEGGNPVYETQNLWSCMLPEWRSEIKDVIMKAKQKRDKILKQYQEKKAQFGTETYYTMIFEIQSDFSRQLIESVISLMNQNGLLLQKERLYPMGGYEGGRIKEEETELTP